MQRQQQQLRHQNDTPANDRFDGSDANDAYRSSSLSERSIPKRLANRSLGADATAATRTKSTHLPTPPTPQVRPRNDATSQITRRLQNGPQSAQSMSSSRLSACSDPRTQLDVGAGSKHNLAAADWFHCSAAGSSPALFELPQSVAADSIVVVSRTNELDGNDRHRKSDEQDDDDDEVVDENNNADGAQLSLVRKSPTVLLINRCAKGNDTGRLIHPTTASHRANASVEIGDRSPQVDPRVPSEQSRRSIRLERAGE